MKRSWFSITMVVGLIGLLVLLGALQYRWVASASEAEADKMQKRVNSDTEHFASDFNREIQNVYFNFQLDPEQWKNRDWNEFNQRYIFWRSKTAYPKLVKSIIFVENSPDAKPLVYSPEKRSFEPGIVPAEFEQLRQKFTKDETFQPIYEEVPALVLPVHDHDEHLSRIMIRTPGDPAQMKMEMPQRYGFLVVLLDASVISDRILPELYNKYFPDAEFRVSVLGKDRQQIFRSAGTVDSSDATARLFELSPDKFLFFANRDLVPGQEGDSKREVFVNQQVQSQTMKTIPRNGAAQGTVRVEVQSEERPRTTVLERSSSEDLPGWTMQVQHRDGSIANYISSQRQRSLATGFGLLILLGGGISLVYFSAMRARLFAQRQIDFVSSVSHEFRTPLAVIYSASENLEDGVAKDQEQVSRYGNLIKNEGKKLSAMVEQILAFAGADSGKQRYNFAETRIADVIDNAIAECSPLIHSADFTVERSVPDDLPPIYADRTALSCAVANLIANSVKYSDGSKWIRVAAENGGQTVRIKVEDHGIGISRKDLNQIFQPFFRANEVVDAQIHGNGLGLSIVKQIAEAHRGNVSVNSSLNKGSEFVIELPLN